ncbi:hypothetical protein CDL15_Pgr006275 [Punica granatum]|nr:hypothetical protein CDL15_Pgr006275 [Punica granatum]
MLKYAVALCIKESPSSECCPDHGVLAVSAWGSRAVITTSDPTAHSLTASCGQVCPHCHSQVPMKRHKYNASAKLCRVPAWILRSNVSLPCVLSSMPFSGPTACGETQG